MHTNPNLRSAEGQILILTALSMVLLLSVAALSIDAAYMYDQRDRLSAAADAAAKSGAMEVRRFPAVTLAALKAFGDREVTNTGFTPGLCGTTTIGQTSVCVNHPPMGGAFVGNPAYVEAIVSARTGTFFGSVLGWTHLTPSVTAVAGTSAGPNCFVMFGSLSWMNNDALNLTDCSAAIGGNVDIGGSNITGTGTAQIAVTGSVISGTISPAAATGAPPPTDPLANLPVPTAPGGVTCTMPWTVPGGATTLTIADVNNYYCGFRFTPGSGTLALSASTTPYYVNGPVTAQNGGSTVNLTVTQATIYISPSGTFSVDASNQVTMQLTAPTSGAYAGIALYQDRTSATAMSFGKNNSDVTLNGAVYAKLATITMKNNGPTSDCSMFVATSVDVKNNGTISMDNTCAAFGGSPLLTVSLAE